MGTVYARQNPKVFAQGIWEQSSTQKLPLGTKWDLDDGRGFIYCKNAAAASATKGMLAQNAVLDTLAQSMAFASIAAIGDNHVHVTYGAGTTATADYFKEGYLIVDEGTGLGEMYKIKTHAAATSGGTLDIYLYDTIRTATVATTSKATAVKHPCDDVIVVPTTISGVCVGVPAITPTASYYFWSQYKGPCPVLVDTGDTLVVGSGATVNSGGTVAGAAIVQAEAGVVQIIGNVLWVSAADKYAIIDLNLSV